LVQTIQEAVLFKKKYGHTIVPVYSYEDRALGVWVSNQRSNFAQGQMKPARQKLLDDIVFMWKAPRGSDAHKISQAMKCSDEPDDTVPAESDSCILGTKVRKEYSIDGLDGTKHIA
jgi:hypothetical protein